MFPAVPPAHGLLLAALSLVPGRFCGSSTHAPEVPHIAAYFGTKTRYEEVNPQLLRDPLAVNASVLRPPPGERCSPLHLTAVLRHGSRLPTAKNVRRILRLSRLLRAQASGGTSGGQAGSSGGTSGGQAGSSGWLRDTLSRWEPWYTEDMDGELVSKGREDLLLLARRLASLLPSLLSEENLRGGRVSFRTSSKPRCVGSMEAFQQGLWQHWGHDAPPAFTHVVDDDLMRFFERCRGYVEGVENNRTALLEVEKFRHGPEMEAVRTRVALRLGLDPQSLTPDLVEAAFFLCSYELSIKSVRSPWCLLFDESDAKVLEYQSDLKQFWKRSHGNRLSGLSSCPLFHHVFRSLDRAGRPRRSSEAPPAPASVLLGHAETLLPLLSLLGLHRDQAPPTAANYAQQHGRSFRSGRVAPYAANLLLLLWDCAGGPRLQLLLNEAPLRFPAPPQEAPRYRDVRAAYRHLLDGCDAAAACRTGGRGGPGGRAPSTEL